MEIKIVDWDGEYILGHGAIRRPGSGFVPVSEFMSEACLHRWLREEPHRTNLRHFAAELEACPDMSNVSDEEVLRRLHSALTHGHRIRLHRAPRRHVRRHHGGHATKAAPAEAHDTKAAIHPCDFEKVAIKCQHMPDPKEKAGKRTMTEALFWRTAGVNQSNLKTPAGSNRRDIEVIASHVERGADEITLEIQGGPGYTCSQHHPTVTITDSAQQRQTFKGTKEVKFKALCRELPPPSQPSSIRPH